MTEKIEHTYILGVRVDVVELPALIAYIVGVIQKKEKSTIANLNIHAMDYAYKLEWFREFTNKSDVVVCDGFGIKWASKFFYGKDLFRYTHVDWFEPLAEKCTKNNFSLFFLGTRQEIVEKAAMVARGKHPGLSITGFHHGFFNKDSNSSETAQVIEIINKASPDILVIGFGMPVQEKWLLENSSKLNVHVIITAGGFFDYLSGETRRAPHWMTDHGLEWLGRLIIDPGRLWKRYLLGNPVFFWRIIKHRVFRYSLPF
jgi:N-acetylglucosaminyldiphosphoundecaprenol N-acetyl-beta-D-mannosaminyltransferase